MNIALFGVAGAPKAGAAKTSATPRVSAKRPGGLAGAASAGPSLPSSGAPVPVQLTPERALAFGPAGLGSGDNPTGARFAIDASAATAWRSDWYRTAEFGHLQTGTGLLVDMGRPVTVTSIQITLGREPGANVELLTGTGPSRTTLHLEAAASDAGGVLTLRPAHPAPGRYLLIWFTALPRDSSGTFQASVYNVRIEGIR